MEKTDYTKLLPLQPPKKLWDSAKVKKALNVHALVYKVGWVWDPYEECKKRMAEIHCTACGETFYYPLCKKEACSGATYYGIVHPSGEEIYSPCTCLCPECGAQVKAIHVSDFGRDKYYRLATTWPITCEQVNGHLALIAWRILKGTDKEGKVEISAWPYEAYISEGKKVVKCVGYWNFFSTVRWTGEWELRARAYDNYGKIASSAFLAPTAAQLKGTEMENSKIGRFMQKGNYPIAYMMVYLKHPNLENLIMQGCEGLVDRLIETCRGYHSVRKDLEHINWKKNRPCEMLGMTKQEFDYFKRNCLSLEGLQMLALLRKYDECAAIQRVPDLLKRRKWDVEMFLERNVAPEKAFRYLDRQGRKYPKDRISATILRDYWKMAEELKEDLGDPLIMWPQRISAAHDQAVERINALEEAKEAEGFLKRFEELKEYCFEKDGLLIRPAMGRQEFRKEGKTLHHCVATYATRHRDGGTAIFFIRRANAPDEPFYTLEYNEKNGTVIQNRGLRNCARTDEVIAFEAAWLEFIKTQKKKGNKNGKSNRRAKGSVAGAVA